MGILGYPLNGILTTKKQWWIPPFRSFSIFSARYTKSVENRVGATRLVIHPGVWRNRRFWWDGWHLTCFKPNGCKYFQPDGVGFKYLLLFLYTPLKIGWLGFHLSSNWSTPFKGFFKDREPRSFGVLRMSTPRYGTLLWLSIALDKLKTHISHTYWPGEATWSSSKSGISTSTLSRLVSFLLPWIGFWGVFATPGPGYTGGPVIAGFSSLPNAW